MSSLERPKHVVGLQVYRHTETLRRVWTAADAGQAGVSSRAASSSCPSDGSARVATVFARPPALLLERSVGDKNALDQKLWDSCCFQAEVYPDLPVASTWRDLLRRTMGQRVGKERKGGRMLVPSVACSGERWTVHTVAAQLRSRDQLRSMMLAAAGLDAGNETKCSCHPADALLLVSGSHPARQLPGASRWLQDSFDLLLAASAMREQGHLPASLSLWAVENPMLAKVERLRRKVDAGADVVLTQPPLLWNRVQHWAEEADKQRISSNVKVVLGLPIITSVGNLEFWLRLCNVRTLPESQHLLSSFPGPQQRSKEEHAAAVRAWNATLIQKSLGLPGVAGLHVMPLTRAARQLTLDFLADGTLPAAL